MAAALEPLRREAVATPPVGLRFGVVWVVASRLVMAALRRFRLYVKAGVLHLGPHTPMGLLDDFCIVASGAVTAGVCCVIEELRLAV